VALRLFVARSLQLDVNRGLGNENSVVKPFLADEQIDRAENGFGTARAQGERLPEGEVSFLVHALALGGFFGVLSAPGVSAAYRGAQFGEVSLGDSVLDKTRIAAEACEVAVEVHLFDKNCDVGGSGIECEPIANHRADIVRPKCTVALEEFEGKFDPKDISVGGPVFDLTKLDWLNGAKIRKLSAEQLADRLLSEGFVGPKAAERAATLPTITGPAIPSVPESASKWTREELVRVLPLFQERLVKLSEFAGTARYLKEAVEPDLAGLLSKVKKADPAALRTALGEAADLLASMSGKPDAEREAALRGIAEKHGLKPGDLFMGLRVAITGATASPPLLPSVDAVGLEESVRRVTSVARAIHSQPS